MKACQRNVCALLFASLYSMLIGPLLDIAQRRWPVVVCAAAASAFWLSSMSRKRKKNGEVDPGKEGEDKVNPYESSKHTVKNNANTYV